MAGTDDIYDDEYYLNLPVDSDRIRTLTDLIDFRAGDAVCEIGCAAGHFLAEISTRIGTGVGIDTAAAAIAAAQAIREREHLNNIEFRQVSAQDFAGDAANRATFDYVLLLDVTEHVEDPVMLEILASATRLMKPEGRLIVHTPNLGYWLERLKDKGVLPQLEGHIAVRDESQYRSLFAKAGMVPVQVTGLPHYRRPLRWIDRILMRLPAVGRLFRSRLFIVARSGDGRTGESP